MSIFKKTTLMFFLALTSMNLYAQLRAVVREPADMFLFYSTSPGQAASDGTARNSPFAASFLKNVDSREPLLMVAVDIANGTLALTAQRQRPVFESRIYANKNYSIASGSSARRYALVFGINNYYNANERFINPSNDAQDISSALIKIGYDVDLRIDADYISMSRAVDEFLRKLSSDRDSEGFFWFGGLGFQINDEKYLLPADAMATSEPIIRTTSISFDFLVDSLQSAGNKINLVFLDTGRTPPFSASTR